MVRAWHVGEREMAEATCCNGCGCTERGEGVEELLQTMAGEGWHAVDAEADLFRCPECGPGPRGTCCAGACGAEATVSL